MTEIDQTPHPLVEQARHGDQAARRDLLELYRDHLRRMVSARLDRRVSSRVDASDVVQDTLADAAAQLDDYLRDQPLPFLPWLRQIAVDRIRDAHRRHLVAQSRSITREQPAAWFSEESAVALGQQLVAHDTSPSNQAMRQELCDAVMGAVAALPPGDREALLMRHIEKLGTAEIALALGMTEAGVKARLYRALTRLRIKLEAAAHP